MGDAFKSRDDGRGAQFQRLHLHPEYDSASHALVADRAANLRSGLRTPLAHTQRRSKNSSILPRLRTSPRARAVRGRRDSRQQSQLNDAPRVGGNHRSMGRTSPPAIDASEGRTPAIRRLSGGTERPPHWAWTLNLAPMPFPPTLTVVRVSDDSEGRSNCEDCPCDELNSSLFYYLLIYSNADAGGFAAPAFF